MNIRETSSVIPHCLRGLVNTGAEPFRRCNSASFTDLSAAWPSLVPHSEGVKKKHLTHCRHKWPLNVCLHMITALKMIKIMLRISPNPTAKLMHYMIWARGTLVIKDSQQVLVVDWRSLIFGPQSILLTEAFKQVLTSNRETAERTEAGLLLAWPPVAILC